jgi:fatty acid desaturase
MPTPLSPEEIDRLARKRAGAKMGWYIHATVYVLVNLLIFSLSQYAFGSRPWSLGPLLGWGVGLVLHGISVFVLGSSSSLRERMVQRERERIERTQSGR